MKTPFSVYKDKYEFLQMERSPEGILQVTLHTNGGPWVFSNAAHNGFGYAFKDIAADWDNKVVIFTGTGNAFCKDAIPEEVGYLFTHMTPQQVDAWYWDGKRFLTEFLKIEAPVITAINGPALIHGEIFMGADIILASENATFQDATHIPTGNVPGGDTQVIWEEILGPVRHRYFQFAGQLLTAPEALAFGVVSEVLPQDQLVARAWEHARRLAQLPALTLRYSRLALNQRIRKRVLTEAPFGMAHLGVSLLENYGGCEGKPMPAPAAV
ncbi:enoyl-CoA hydratase/isomerase family protein [Hymenobacter terrenus]|uniref:enoyl-CoA hydratase/isomerase family protein n=1 Tax=Hymenobacter terrenus TaxID=1629124 RepID=UPI000619F29F|nr:enoyl-CoA hydratase/isomerase family protein [Hymenobacter terrenus]